MTDQIQSAQNNNEASSTSTETQKLKETQELKESSETFNLDAYVKSLPEEDKALLPEDYFQKLKEKGELKKEEVEALVREDLNLIRWHQAYQQEKLKKLNEEWVKQAKEDPEIGKQNFEEALGIAKKGLKAFATQPLIEFLDSSGLGNHPEVIRLFYKIGQLIKDDTLTLGAPSASEKKSLAEILYSK